MRRICTAAFALLALGLSGVAQAWSGNVNASVGGRMLDEDDWSPLDEQPALGVLADFQIADLPLYAAVGLQVSAEEDDDGTRETVAAISDFSAGLKVMPASGVFRPYAGAGFTSVGVSVEIEDDVFGDDDDDDQSFGYYLGGGAIFRVTTHFNIGVDMRWIRGTDIELFGVEGDADSFVATALFGYGWGD